MDLREKIQETVEEHNALAAEVEEKRQKLLTLIGRIQAYQGLLEEEAASNGEGAPITGEVLDAA